jgi:uncharacterized protein YndB with AHSA1/START domain
MTTMTQDRKIEKQIRIAAPPAAVWKALTDADELARWFPLEARVKPGKGGSIWMSWGPGFDGESSIELWEPEHRLRKVSKPKAAPAGEEGGPTASPLAVDFYLEGKGGETVLRIVQSSFGRGSDFDAEFEGMEIGWGLYLRNLRHYLEHHAGAQCHHTFAGHAVALSLDDAFARLLGGDGLARQGRLEGLREGDAFSIVTANGQALEGVVESLVAPKVIALAIGRSREALVRFTLMDMKSVCYAGLEQYVYGLAPERAAEITKGLEALLASALPSP